MWIIAAISAISIGGLILLGIYKAFNWAFNIITSSLSPKGRQQKRIRKRRRKW